MNDQNKNKIISEFRTILLEMEKDNLQRLNPKGDSLMIESLKTEFEKVVNEYENN